MIGAIGAGMGAGLLKSYLVDKPQEDRQRAMAATTARYSPWTGMKPGEVQVANPMGAMMQGGMAGAGLGQQMDSADTQNQLAQSQIASNNAWAQMPLNQQQDLYQRSMQSHGSLSR